MVDSGQWDGRCEQVALDQMKLAIEGKFSDKNFPESAIRDLLNQYSTQPQMIRDRVHAKVTIFEVINVHCEAGITEWEACLMERVLRPSALKLSSSRPEY